MYGERGIDSFVQRQAGAGTGCYRLVQAHSCLSRKGGSVSKRRISESCELKLQR